MAKCKTRPTLLKPPEQRGEDDAAALVGGLAPKRPTSKWARSFGVAG